MPRRTRISDAGVNAEADALAALLNGGYLRIYNGSQPVTANTPFGSQTLLAELRFGSPAFGPAISGVLNAHALTSEDDAPATGTATWFRCLKADGTSVVFDGSVASSNANLNLNNPDIQIHAEVAIGSLSLTLSENE